MPFVETHVDVMKVRLEQTASAGQAARRALERQVRLRALDVADRLTDLGYGLAEVARRLGVSVRTLRYWEARYRQRDDAMALLGRPPANAGPEQQHTMLAYLKAVGPGVGVPSLRAQFPTVARAELTELVQCYRALWREQHRHPVHVLHWQRPGTVWGIDFAQAPSLIDGIYPYLLAVRDLASGQQLLWRPVLAQSAAVVRAELVPLFLAYGAPWVLKSDNGPAFRADATKRLLARWQVFALFSPPHTPSYNGAIEAAIGSLKIQSERLAQQAGHPGVWTSALAEAARHEANTTAHPRRLHGATPAEVWHARQCPTAEERAQFRATVTQFQADAWPEQGPLPEDLSHWQQAAIDRVALRRALLAHDLLLFRRRRIPARIERPKVTNKG